MLTHPLSELLEGGLTELVGINEEVNTSDFGGSVDVSITTRKIYLPIRPP